MGNLDLNDKRISGKLSGTFAKRGKKGRHFFRSVSLVFKKDILEPGVEYQFKLAVLSEQFPDEVGEALVSIKTNAPPHEGKFCARNLCFQKMPLPNVLRLRDVSACSSKKRAGNY